MSEWFETLDDRIWLAPDKVGAEEAKLIREIIHLRKGQSVLDAPCGAGRIAVHLARAGCKVTGVDLRRKFINRARRRFQKEGLSGRFQVLDLRNLAFENEFHGIFNWAASFGYFSESENVDVLKRYVRALRKGGRLVIDQPNRERILRNFSEKGQIGTVHLRSHWDKDMQLLIVHRIIDGKEDPKSTSFTRLYTPGQMRHLFEKVGLLVESFYGSHAGDSFGRSSKRMIVVGRKS